jgi:hypothetical protein
MREDPGVPPLTPEELSRETSSQAGRVTEERRGPICGAIYADWADGGEFIPRICWREPQHEDAHVGEAATQDRITQAAYRNQQDSRG